MTVFQIIPLLLIDPQLLLGVKILKFQPQGKRPYRLELPD